MDEHKPLEVPGTRRHSSLPGPEALLHISPRTHRERLSISKKRKWTARSARGDEPGAKRLRTSGGERRGGRGASVPGKVSGEATYDGDLQTVKQWVEVHHANVNEGNEDDGDSTPLFAAASRGNTEIVRYLVERPGVDVNQATTDDGTAPLMIAAQEGQLDIVRCLIQSGRANLNAIDHDGDNALL